MDNKVKQQALFSLLGEDYVRIHFPHHKYDLSVLDPPKTRPEVRKAYVEEMKQLVQEQLGVTLKECGLVFYNLGYGVLRCYCQIQQDTLVGQLSAQVLS